MARIQHKRSGVKPPTVRVFSKETGAKAQEALEKKGIQSKRWGHWSGAKKPPGEKSDN